jgi:hypothetical protein
MTMADDKNVSPACFGAAGPPTAMRILHGLDHVVNPCAHLLGCLAIDTSIVPDVPSSFARWQVLLFAKLSNLMFVFA